MPTVPALGAIVALLLCHRMPAHGLKLTTRAQVDEVASFDTDAVFGGPRTANWTFLDRFAYGADASWTWHAQLDAKVDWPADKTWDEAVDVNKFTNPFRLLAFYDDQWDALYPDFHGDCQSWVGKSVNKWRIPAGEPEGGRKYDKKLRREQDCKAIPRDNTEGLGSGSSSGDQPSTASVTYRCDGLMEFGALQTEDNGVYTRLDDKYWFMVLACCDCDPKSQMRLQLEMHLTNGDSNWIREFSTDESWVYSLVVFGLAFNLLVLFAQLYSDKDYTGGSHTTRFLFKLSICLNIIAFICYVAYRDEYSSSGQPDDKSEKTGDIFWLLGEVVFQALLFLLAKGWTIYRPELRKSSLIKMGVFLALYFIVFVNVLTYEHNNFDPAVVRFRYDSDPGTVMCIMYFISWGWFSWYVYVTLKPMLHGTPAGSMNLGDVSGHCPEEKYLFFKAFWTIFTVWFLMFPIAVFALISDAKDFNRTNGAWTVFVIRQCLGQAVMLALWWPSVHNIFFPFERSASMIGMAPPKNDAGYQDEPYQDVKGAGVEYQVNIDQARARRDLFQGSPTSLGRSMAPQSPERVREDDPDEYIDHSRTRTPRASQGSLNHNKLPPIGSGVDERGEESSRV